MNQISTARSGQLDDSRLAARLDSIRQALGASRLGVARRLPTAGAADRVYEVLACVGDGTDGTDPARLISLAVLEETMRLGAPCAIGVGRGRPAWERRLRRWGCRRIEAWPFPADRLPSVFFVAHFADAADPGERRRYVARTGMDALARALAPPSWIPLARQRMPGTLEPRSEALSLRAAVQRFECSLIRKALRDAGGNKTEAARQLRMSRQGLYRKLRSHGLMDPGPGPDLDTEASSA